MKAGGRPVTTTSQPPFWPLSCEDVCGLAQTTGLTEGPVRVETSDYFENIEVRACRGCPVTNEPPPFVTFTTGAQLLIREGLVKSITPDGLRYIARTAKDWPFGTEPGKHPYIQVGNARTMETGIFLAYFRDGPARGGRGPNKQ